ncbi:MAG: hypothetical protein ACRCUP_01825 [Mycoplasmatales bacterium]
MLSLFNGTSIISIIIIIVVVLLIAKIIGQTIKFGIKIAILCVAIYYLLKLSEIIS